MVLLGGQSRQETLGCMSWGEKLGLRARLLLVYQMKLGKQEPEFHSTINKLTLLQVEQSLHVGWRFAYDAEFILQKLSESQIPVSLWTTTCSGLTRDFKHGLQTEAASGFGVIQRTPWSQLVPWWCSSVQGIQVTLKLQETKVAGSERGKKIKPSNFAAEALRESSSGQHRREPRAATLLLGDNGPARQSREERHLP